MNLAKKGNRNLKNALKHDAVVLNIRKLLCLVRWCWSDTVISVLSRGLISLERNQQTDEWFDVWSVLSCETRVCVTLSRTEQLFCRLWSPDQKHFGLCRILVGEHRCPTLFICSCVNGEAFALNRGENIKSPAAQIKGSEEQRGRWQITLGSGSSAEREYFCCCSKNVHFNWFVFIK